MHMRRVHVCTACHVASIIAWRIRNDHQLRRYYPTLTPTLILTLTLTSGVIIGCDGRLPCLSARAAKLELYDGGRGS